MEKQYQTFAEFWPYYLGEHKKPLTRGLHYMGTTIVLGLLASALATQTWWLLAIMPVGGYGFAWVGHFFVEKNRPATFTYPFYSLAGDFVMYGKMLTGQIGREVKKLESGVGDGARGLRPPMP